MNGYEIKGSFGSDYGQVNNYFYGDLTFQFFDVK